MTGNHDNEENEMTDDRTMQYGDDPAGFNVDQVNAYLAALPNEASLNVEEPNEERGRVLDAEKAGEARKGILSNWSDAEAETPDAEPGGPTVAVTLRQHWTDDGGTNHVPGDTVNVDPQTADTLTNSTWGTKV